MNAFVKRFTVKPSKLGGSIVIPPSKSQTLRAVLFASVAEGKSQILNPLKSSDSEAMIAACRLFGAKITETEGGLEVVGVGGIPKIAENVIHAGNSGIVLRFCSGIGALMDYPVVITGDHSICHQRPMQPLLDALQQWGVRAESMRGDGYAPVVIRGPVKGGTIKILGEDSQPVSALLIAAALAPQQTCIEVENPGELPWIDLTLHWLDRLGVKYEREGYERYSLRGQSRWQGFTYEVPSDLSSAAFPIVSALITKGTIQLNNVDLTDPQGDKLLFELFREMGADIEVQGKSLFVRGGKPLKGIKANLNGCIDGIAALAALACYAEGETVIYNASIARSKECNRIRCLQEELSKMGAHISETADGLKIRGAPLKGGQVHSYGDHRMAMALAVAAFGAQGPSVIDQVDCVRKTFPHFASVMQKAGALIEEHP
jgi:3-phosphoshikimate 1-carboxyvinyltransferase